MSGFAQEPLVAALDAIAIEDSSSSSGEQESSEEDEDSNCSDSVLTQSLTSSIADYVFENGRRYHRYAEGQYLLPNDELEQERLELHHFIYLMLLRGKHFLAPIDKPKRILDVGTGTGIWAMDMAEKFPHAEVIGTDLSPIQPSWTLPNCTFIIDDAELEWHWPRPFDFVHARNLGQSIKDWQALALQMFQHTAPGGWVELAETNNRVVSDDDSIPADSALARIVRANLEGVQRLGLRTPDGDELRLLLAHAGFVDIEIHAVKQPWGGWPANDDQKKAGLLMLVNAEAALEAYTLALFTRVLGMTIQQVRELCEAAVADVKDPNVHAYNIVYYAIGRRPREDEAQLLP